MRLLYFGAISLILNTICYSQVKKGELDTYTSQIKEQEEAINNFNFNKYDPIVEKKIKENFNNFKSEMEKARSEDPNLKAQDARTKSFYDKDNANIERWSRKTQSTTHSQRRVIQIN